MSWRDGYLPYRYDRVVVSPEHEYYKPKSGFVWGPLTVGRFSFIGERPYILAFSPVTIGAFCRIAADFQLCTHESHNPSLPSTFMFGDVFDLPWSRGCGLVGLSHARETIHGDGVTIGNDVAIGNSVHVFAGVDIGDGCVITPGAFVNSDCIPYGIYEGVPARLVGMRFADAVVEQLLHIRWWDWPVEKLLLNAPFFECDLQVFEGPLECLIQEPALADEQTSRC